MEAIVERITSVFDRLTAWANRYPAAATNRVVGASVALPAWTVLGIAAWLTPSEKGYGTHTQLGLGDCIMMQLTDWPCPMCGMTTTFTLLAHFRPVDAFFNQPFGLVLFAATVIGAFAGLFDLATGRNAIGRVLGFIGKREQLIAAGLLVGMFGGWLYKAVRLHPHVFGLG